MLILQMLHQVQACCDHRLTDAVILCTPQIFFELTDGLYVMQLRNDIVGSHRYVARYRTLCGGVPGRGLAVVCVTIVCTTAASVHICSVLARGAIRRGEALCIANGVHGNMIRILSSISQSSKRHAQAGGAASLSRTDHRKCRSSHCQSTIVERLTSTFYERSAHRSV